MAIKLTTEDFIRKAKEVHGEKYDYSKVEYVNNSTKVIIICSMHGEFLMKPANHINMKQRCPKCTGNAKLTTEDFIIKAREVHGEKYDYSKVNYINTQTKVIIICPEHGEFEQSPNNHIRQNCPKCTGNYMTTEFFKEKAKLVHGEKYDYSKVEYVNQKIKVIIICPKHGEFLQGPSSHLLGTGCPICADENSGSSQRHTNEEFIQKSKVIHGNKYDYSKVNYINSSTNVTIICPEHGEFEQLPASHVEGKNCGKCAGTYMDTEYFIQKSKAIHGNKYDYSKVNYISQKFKVIIVCPEHGEFEQQPTSHYLNGCGCPECAKKMSGASQKLDTKTFIEKSRAVHGDKYDYSKSTYVNQKTKIKIICAEHGEFIQSPSKHYGGQGCPLCEGLGFKYKTLDEVKEIIKPFGIKTQREYFDWWKKNEKFCRENGIPFGVERYYRKK